MKERVRLGFVGVGSMAQCAHLRSYVTVPDCDVVAIAEPRERTGRRVAERYGVPSVYTGSDEMLAREKLDGIVACRHFGQHGAMVPELLKARLPLFIEKPLADTVEQGERLADAVDKSGTWVMVGYHKRSDPATMYAKDEIEHLDFSGALGNMNLVRVSMPPGDWIQGGFDDLIREEDVPAVPDMPLPAGMDRQTAETYFHVVNYYVHQVNLIRHFLGESFEVAYADPSGVLMAGHSDSGVCCSLEMGAYRTTVDWQEAVLVAFERGYVKVDLPAPLVRRRPGRVEILRDPGGGERPVVETPHLPWVDAMQQQAVNFVEAIRGEKSPMCQAREALDDLVLARDYVRLLREAQA